MPPGRSWSVWERLGTFWEFLGDLGAAWGALGAAEEHLGAPGAFGDAWERLGTSQASGSASAWGALGAAWEGLGISGTSGSAQGRLGAPGTACGTPGAARERLGVLVWSVWERPGASGGSCGFYQSIGASGARIVCLCMSPWAPWGFLKLPGRSLGSPGSIIRWIPGASLRLPGSVGSSWGILSPPGAP